MTKTKTLFFTPHLVEQMYAHCKVGFPSEVVGILAGNRKDNQVQKIQPLVNERADTKNRYQVNGLIVYRASKALEANGYDVLGYYHSHPNHPSHYSEYDREHALPNLSYAIVSVMNGEIATLQSWRLSEDRSLMIEELVHVH